MKHLLTSMQDRLLVGSAPTGTKDLETPLGRGATSAHPGSVPLEWPWSSALHIDKGNRISTARSRASEEARITLQQDHTSAGARQECGSQHSKQERRDSPLVMVGIPPTRWSESPSSLPYLQPTRPGVFVPPSCLASWHSVTQTTPTLVRRCCATSPTWKVAWPRYSPAVVAAPERQSSKRQPAREVRSHTVAPPRWSKLPQRTATLVLATAPGARTGLPRQPCPIAPTTCSPSCPARTAFGSPGVSWLEARSSAYWHLGRCQRRPPLHSRCRSKGRVPGRELIAAPRDPDAS